MDRRDFLQSATLVATAGATGATGMAGTTGVLAAEAANDGALRLAQAGAASAPAAVAEAAHRGPLTRRWVEQRWVLDNIIQANGIDWDQPRSVYWNVPCGIAASADFAAIRQRVKKYADCSPAFETVARRREATARTAEEARDLVTARENYFMAAIHWGAAQWPIDENNEQNLAYNKKKRECFTAYARLADHRVEPVWIPFDGKALPAWFHLPPGYSGGRIPVVVFVPGMDSFKEASVWMYGDPYLSRGFAVLAMEGPGQYECPTLGIYMSMDGWEATGKACMDWLSQRAEVDPERVAISGRSFGSFAGTIAASAEPRYRACAVSATCHEPGWHTIFQEASPTFKMRFMYMANYTDEAKFDEFRTTLTWEGRAEKIRMPYLCAAGEFDELSPLENTERLLKALQGPKRFVVYQESRHATAGVASTNLGPYLPAMVADWIAARFRGEPFPSERWFVDATGRVTKTAL
ncbi:MAG: alpha/beta hydrolase family protein [Xanthobacteraceae bacterium]